MATVFQTPQFKLMPDRQGPRFYANVNNCMELALSSGMYHVAVEVPTGLFTLMKDVFKVPRDAEVSLSIDEVQATPTRYVFSITWRDQIRDLWEYTKLPAWLCAEEYRLP